MPKRGQPASRAKRAAPSAFAADNGESEEEMRKKRQRNRLSQRSFRERQTAYLNELKESARKASQSESERNRMLHEENVDLRNSFLHMRKQVLGMLFTLEEIGREIGKHLNLEPDGPAGSAGPGTSCCAHVRCDRCNPRENDPLGPDSNSEPRGFDQGYSADGGRDHTASQLQTPEDTSNESLDGGFETSSPQLEEALDGICEPESAENDTAPAVTEASHESAQGPVPASVTLIPSFQDDINLEVVPPTEDSRELIDPSTWLQPGDFETVVDLTYNGLLIPSPTQLHRQLPQSNSFEGNMSFHSTFSASQSWVSPPLSQPVGFLPPFQLGDSRANSHAHGAGPSRSLFLEHVEMLESLVQRKLVQMGDAGTEEGLSSVVATVVTLFYNYAWEGTSGFWSSCYARSIVEAVLLWRCKPSVKTWAGLPEWWKPTNLQLTVPHSCIIDWFPLPGLRDALILNYNNSEVLDQLFWDCMDAWVIRVDDIATVLTNVGHEPGLIGIWNVVEAMNGSGSVDAYDFAAYSSRISSLGSERPPSPGGGRSKDEAGRVDATGQRSSTEKAEWCPMSLDLILSSKRLARDLFYHLNMYDTISYWLFDSYLFEKYPELKFHGYEKLVARGNSYRRPSARVGPTQMTNWTANLYRKAILT